MRKETHSIIGFEGSRNFSSYDDVERLSRFSSRAALDSYRSERLEVYEKPIRFLEREIPCAPYDVVEIGSGSSALLFGMERKGLLGSAVGIEISKSRHEFAERWLTDGSFRKVKNWLGNFVEYDFERASSNLFLVTNDTLTYLEPEGRDYVSSLLKKAYIALRVEGRLVIEVYNGGSRAFGKLKNEKSRNFWRALPETNVFRYALYQEDYDPETNRLRSDATYLPWSGNETRKCDISYVFTLEDLRSRLDDCGFKIEKVFGGLSGEVWDPDLSESILVICAKT